MEDGTPWTQSWELDDMLVFRAPIPVDLGDEGTMWLSLNNGGDPMPEGAYS